MRGERKCETCRFASLEKVRKDPQKKGDNTYQYQLFCRHSPAVLRVEKDGWCFQWGFKP